ncbi:MAG: pyrroline-5-carboxylate reductase [Thermoanaerobaculia bacterium]
MSAPTIAILGLGTMGRTIAEGLLGAGQPKGRILATSHNRQEAARLTRETGLEVGADNAATAGRADVVIVCLKPATVPPVAREIVAGGALRPKTLVVSIAAGVTTAALEALFGDKTPVVRAMPNTPCRIGAGVTVLTPGRWAKAAHLQTARALFAPLGRVLELEEKHLDTVTGLSASGPAFIYVILEALADGAVARGLPRQVALELAAQMTYGAAAMVLATGRHPAALKDDVTTPAGCTIAGILTLEDGKIRSVLSRAVEVAALRAGELAAGR